MSRSPRGLSRAGRGRSGSGSHRPIALVVALVLGSVSLAPGASAQGSGAASQGSGIGDTPASSAVGAGSVDPSSLQPSVAPGSLYGAPSLSVAALTIMGSPIPLTSVLGSVAAVGSENFTRPGGGAPSEPISTRDESIVASEVLRIEPLWPNSPHAHDRRAEVWTVTSASMQREVRVEVYRAPAGVDAPAVYFLDGLGSESPSAWSTGMGWGDPVLRDRPVSIVVPTGGPASMWSDWERDDPVLGPNNWETFLTRELPPLLETGLPERADGLAHNGSWGVMGLSMGASAALHLANTYDMFGAVAGVSGAYSTGDDLGYQYARLTVSARGGEVTNMWGPRGSSAWRAHDTLADPSGLQGKTVYLSAATGLVGSSELGRFGSDELVLAEGHLLEKGSYESTRALESALTRVAGVDLRVNYLPAGIHSWPVFVSQMRPGTGHVLSGLAPAVANGHVSTGGVADRASSRTAGAAAPGDRSVSTGSS